MAACRPGSGGKHLRWLIACKIKFNGTGQMILVVHLCRAQARFEMYQHSAACLFPREAYLFPEPASRSFRARGHADDQRHFDGESRSSVAP
jgi:hypothetical protein